LFWLGFGSSPLLLAATRWQRFKKKTNRKTKYDIF